MSTENPIDHSPASIYDLIIRCTSDDPRSRPSFPEILDELAGASSSEIKAAVFFRHLAAVKESDATDLKSQHDQQSVPQETRAGASHQKRLVHNADGVDLVVVGAVGRPEIRH